MIKKGNDKKKKVDQSTRVKLIRKGNQLFSEGKIDLAEKIFVTIDYKDGLIRLGDHFFKNKNIYKSVEMYFLSENKNKINTFCKKIALIIEKLLKEDKLNEKLLENKTENKKLDKKTNEYDKILINKKINL